MGAWMQEKRKAPSCQQQQQQGDHFSCCWWLQLDTPGPHCCVTLAPERAHFIHMHIFTSGWTKLRERETRSMVVFQPGWCQAPVEKYTGQGSNPRLPHPPIVSAPCLPWQQNMKMCKQCVHELFWPPRNYLLKPRRGHSSGFRGPDCGPGVHLKHSGAEDAPGSGDHRQCHCLPVAKPISLMELSSWLHITGLDEEHGVSSPLNQLCLLYFLPLESIKPTLRTKIILHVSS